VNGTRYRRIFYVHIFYAKKILGEFEREFIEGLIWAAFLVPQQRGYDMSIA
jgi:hypothetical protein